MRPGPPRGETLTYEVVVTPAMAPYAEAVEAPAVCGTAALAAELERVCRRVLEPHLEPGEEGLGGRLELTSRVPVPVGETLTLQATVATVRPSELVCEVLVRHDGRNVARGSYQQHLVGLDELDREIAGPRRQA